MSILITIDSEQLPNQSSDNFEVSFDRPITLLEGNWSVGLISARVWYSWYNITAAFSNNTLRYYNGSVWRNVTIPDGLYDISDIQNYLQTIMIANNDYSTVNGDNVYYVTLGANNNTLKTTLTISNGYQLDLSVSSLNQILGFSSSIFTTSQDSTNQVDITRGVNTCLLHCSLIDSGVSYIGSGSSDVIYSFVPNNIPGSLLVYTPTPVTYLSLTQKVITRIRMTLTDQLQRPINLNGQNASYVLELKKQ